MYRIKRGNGKVYLDTDKNIPECFKITTEDTEIYGVRIGALNMFENLIDEYGVIRDQHRKYTEIGDI